MLTPTTIIVYTHTSQMIETTLMAHNFQIAPLKSTTHEHLAFKVEEPRA